MSLEIQKDLTIKIDADDVQTLKDICQIVNLVLSSDQLKLRFPWYMDIPAIRDFCRKIFDETACLQVLPAGAE